MQADHPRRGEDDRLAAVGRGGAHTVGRRPSPRGNRFLARSGPRPSPAATATRLHECGARRPGSTTTPRPSGCTRGCVEGHAEALGDAAHLLEQLGRRGLHRRTKRVAARSPATSSAAGKPMRSPTWASRCSSASAIRPRSASPCARPRSRPDPQTSTIRSGEALGWHRPGWSCRGKVGRPWDATRATTSSSSPSQIGPKTLRNRFYQVPHCTGFGVEKPWSQAAHREVKAEGGWAAVCTETAPSRSTADETPFISARMWDDHDLRPLATRARGGPRAGPGRHRALALRRARRELRDAALRRPAPSQIASDFVRTSRRSGWKSRTSTDVIRLGDGCDPLPRRRVRHRLRLRRLTRTCSGRSSRRSTTSATTSTAARSRTARACGSRRSARCATPSAPTARSPAGSRSAAGRSGDRPRRGRSSSCGSPTTSSTCGTSTSARSTSGRRTRARRASSRRAGSSSGRRGVREATAKPIVGVGRLTTPDRMAEIIESGVWDLIGAARPNIADPWIPRKIDEGRLGDIRECIGCNMCISKGDNRRHIGCTQNATAGEEYRRGWHPERFDPPPTPTRGARRGGRAGGDGVRARARPPGHAPRAAGRRGRRGGRHHALDPAPAGPREWGRLLDWRLGQLGQLPNVEIETGVRDGRGRGAGGRGRHRRRGDRRAVGHDGLNGATRGPIPGRRRGARPRPHARGGHARRQAAPGRRVVVYDCEGYFMGAGMAELLAARGPRGRARHACEKVAPFCDETLEGPLLRQHLHDLGIAMRAERAVSAVEPGRRARRDDVRRAV